MVELSHATIARLGGRLDARPFQGGTELVVTLPLAVLSPLTPRRLLIVEDDPALSEVLSRAFKGGAAIVCTAAMDVAPAAARRKLCRAIAPSWT